MRDRKQQAFQRPARIEGQVHGSAHKVEEDPYCMDILN